MSIIQRAYKTELDLNDQQTTVCCKHAGAARWAYNWGLACKQDTYRTTGKSPSAMELHRELNALKRPAVPWMYGVSKCAPQEAVRNLDNAFAHVFRRARFKQAGKLPGKVGYPQRKSKKRGLGSFRLTGSIVVFPDAIQLPCLGRLRLKERGYLPTDTKILSATVTEQAGHWYVSVLVEQEHVVPVHAGTLDTVVGVDWGVQALATCSDGTVIPNPRLLKRRLKKIKRLQRSVSRKLKSPKNRHKAAHRLARLCRKASNRRNATVHPLTTQLAKTKSVVVIENVPVAGMLKHHHLAQAIVDVGFGEFRRQLLYKAEWYGSRVVLADRWEPSGRTCSGGGWYDATMQRWTSRIVCFTVGTRRFPLAQ